jgi:pseudo-rSAM protein
MFDSNKNYWLYIAPYVYCCIKDAQALLYNTQNGANMEINKQELLTLIRSLHEKKNLGAVYCEGEMLMQKPYGEFVNEFCTKGMGNLVDVVQMPEKPIQLMPVLNLQRDVEKLQKGREDNTGVEALRYLVELNIYLHATCGQNCLLCDGYFRQSLCCMKKHGTSPEALGISTLKDVLSQIRYGVVGKINLLGGNILAYSCYEEFSTFLADFKERVHIWNHYANFGNCKILFSEFAYEVPVTFPLDETVWKQCVTLLKDMKVRYHFFIVGTEEYEKAELLIENYGIISYMVHPVYTDMNHGFFEEYVYTSREDIFQTKLSFRQIFAHQKLNTHFFGSLTIMPDGEVYANINSSTLGNITTDTLLNIINKEMLTNTAWRKVRDNTPCSDCLYQYLCPSPSNYEIVIGKSNMCHIKN